MLAFVSCVTIANFVYVTLCARS